MKFALFVEIRKNTHKNKKIWLIFLKILGFRKQILRFCASHNFSELV